MISFDIFFSLFNFYLKHSSFFLIIFCFFLLLKVIFIWIYFMFFVISNWLLIFRITQRLQSFFLLLLETNWCYLITNFVFFSIQIILNYKTDKYFGLFGRFFWWLGYMGFSRSLNYWFVLMFKKITLCGIEMY